MASKVAYKKIDEIEYVLPTFLPQRQSMTRRVAPREIIDYLYQNYYEDLFSVSKDPVERDISACTGLDSEKFLTIQCTCDYNFFELKYPGGAGDITEIRNKWIYIFNEKKLEKEIYANSEGEFFECQISHKKEIRVQVEKTIKLVRGQNEHPYNFILTGKKLNSKAIKYLQDFYLINNFAVGFSSSKLRKKVYLIDSFDWAIDISQKYYTPCVENYLNVIKNENRVSQLYIGSILKGLIEGGDQLDIKDNLQENEPNKFLEFHKNEVIEKRRKMEESGAYLAHFVESHEVMALEMSLGISESDFDYVIEYWSQISSGLIVSNSGKTLIQRTLNELERFPAKYLFNEAMRKNPLDFASVRWQSKGTLGIFFAFIPEILQRNSTTKDMVKYFAENVAKLSKPDKDQIERILKGRPVGRAKGSKSLKKGKIKSQKARQRLIKKSQIFFQNSKRSKVANFLEDKKIFSNAAISVLEIINLSLTIEEFFDAGDARDSQNWVNLAGALGDASEHLFSMLDDFIKSDSKFLMRSASAFGIVAGICDLYDFAVDGTEAYAEHDYGVLASKIVQGAGALASVVGSSVVLYSSFGGAAGSWTGPGAILTSIGGALIGVGSGLNIYLSKSPYEYFTSFCFLGENNADSQAEEAKGWTNFKMPADNIDVEILILHQLLAQFRVRMFAGVDTTFLTIYPGFYKDKSYFNICLNFDWKNGEKRSVEFKVYPKSLENGLSQSYSNGKDFYSLPNAISGSLNKTQEAPRVESISINLQEDREKTLINSISYPNVRLACYLVIEELEDIVFYKDENRLNVPAVDELNSKIQRLEIYANNCHHDIVSTYEISNK